MNRFQLVEAMAGKFGAFKQFQTLQGSQKAIDLFFLHIAESLLRGEKVELRGFGSFIVKNYKSYLGRDPRSGVSIVVKPKKLPWFKPGKYLKEAVDPGGQNTGRIS
jgi:integration host factor subunit beta